jgi:hypothetical protein
MSIAEQLLLDPKRVQLAIDVYEGFARATLEDMTSDSLIVNGSCLAIAASLASMIDVRRSKELFRSAADAHYRQAHTSDIAPDEGKREPTRRIHEEKMSFARVLASCGADLNQLGRFMANSKERTGSFLSPDTMASLLLAEAMLDISGSSFGFEPFTDILREEAWRMQYYDAGRARIPLFHYLQIAELPKQLEQPRHSIQDLAVAVLNLVEHTMAGAVSSGHWPKLHCSVLPIEPEVLGLCLILDAACRKTSHGRSTLDQVVGDRVGKLSFAYVRVAVAFGETDHERERPRAR